MRLPLTLPVSMGIRQLPPLVLPAALAARNRRAMLVKGVELDDTAKVYKKRMPDEF
jgi:hypothetical protein